ncbi:MAG TPA: DUF6361 family protein [Jatrophihabitans sp.]|jgi:hypothetical protein|uniref:DUF6361 family protein n=1 Tax=Jatrophihabitans sp. TaxID=1932789 RepID=UPI002F00205C
MSGSTFGWLAYDASEKQRALEVVESLKQPGTVDELGIGVIRDTLARVMFPGASVLHTRARYFTFIPALISIAAREESVEKASSKLHDLEVSLIFALLKGDPTAEGLIGREAKRNLKRMPSAAHWAALRRYGLVTAQKRSIDQVLRAAVGAGRRAAATVQNPGDDHDASRPVYGLDATAAHGWLPDHWRRDGATFTMKSAEAEYLRERIMTSTAGSLYEWFLINRVAPAGFRYVWDHDDVARFPARMRLIMRHAKCFHHLIQGAAILYNLYVSRMVEDDELVAAYENQFEDWDRDIRDFQVLADWSIDEFITAIRQLNPRLGPVTANFVKQWDGLVRQPPQSTRANSMEELVRRREWDTKKARARLFNPAARSDWRGNAGLIPLDYNWSVAARIVNDIQEAL